MKILSVFSVSQNYWKHRGTENIEESAFKEKIPAKENLVK
jgi:hypothetical protein